MRRITLIVLFIVGTVRCFSSQENPQNVAEMFDSPTNLKAVATAEHIDACVLTPIFAPPPKPGDRNGQDIRPKGYIEGEYITVPSKEASLLTSTLLADSTYRWGVARGCLPEYHMRVRYQKGDRIVTVDFCFDCRILRIAEDGKFYTAGLFDFDRNVFLRIAKFLFPKDSIIQSLGESE